MDTIQIKDKRFTISLPEEEILKAVERVAARINRDLAGKDPLFLSVLNGAFMFTADLMKRITIPCEISFIKLASYAGTSSTGTVRQVMGLNQDISGRTVVIVEDIVDTGLTMKRLLEILQAQQPEAIHIATLLVKPNKLQVDLDIAYAALEIPNDFIVGYGLDYDGFGRNYKDIYTFKPMPMLNIVIFGAPGSGKGTQSERIVAEYGLNHISTGDVLRAEIKNGTELGKVAKSYIDQGQLLPDHLIIDILAATLDSFKESKGVIFDGFPRTIAQAEALKKMLAERGQQVNVMLDLDVPEEELMQRLLKRGQECGRADDNEETIKKRLVVYHSQTAPLIDWYKQEGIYAHIHGLGKLEDITAEICQAVDQRK